MLVHGNVEERDKEEGVGRENRERGRGRREICYFREEEAGRVVEKGESFVSQENRWWNLA